jgi:hypothetical protein
MFMTKLNLSIVCCLVTFNVALLTSNNSVLNLLGAGCNPASCCAVSFVQYECFHVYNDPDGAPCRNKLCIFNGIAHLYCG